MEPSELWEKLCGQNSLIYLFADTYGLHHLVQDVIVEVIDGDNIQACATIDPDDGVTPLIRITTGAYTEIRRVMEESAKADHDDFPWISLGYERDDFEQTSDFAEFMTTIIMDIILVHEISHIARGHVNHYVKSLNMGLFEADDNGKSNLRGFRRLALELDADSTSVYIFIGLYEFLLEKSKIYCIAKNISVYIVTVGIAFKILFAILGKSWYLRRSNKNEGKSLMESHLDLSHPHPSLREEFAHQRIIQLAINAEEKSLFHNCLEKAYSLFIDMIEKNLFPLDSLESWKHPPEKVSEFLNVLIEEIEKAADEGWMKDGTRIEKCFEAIDLIINHNK